MTGRPWQSEAVLLTQVFCDMHVTIMPLTPLRSFGIPTGSTIRPFSEKYEPSSLAGTYQSWYLGAFIIHKLHLLFVCVDGWHRR